MQKNTKIAVLLGLVAVVSLLPGQVLAANPTPNDFIPSKASLESGAWISMILDGLNVLAWIAFDLIDKLLDPDFLFNTVGGNTSGSQIFQTLNKIWVLSRNIMNVLFAVILVIAAIYTTIKADLSVVKENFGRFVLGVVFVNFSWLFPLMIIDFANIMTNVVYGIPSELATTVGTCKVPDTKTGTEKTCKIIQNVLYFPEEKKQPTGDDCTSPKSIEVAEGCSPKYNCKFGLICYQEVDWNTNTTPYKSVIHGLVYNYAKLGDIARLPNTAAPAANASNIRLWLMYIVRQLVSIVFMVALAFPLMALALAFLMRIPILWITAAFMPFYFVGWVLNGKVPGAEKTQGILDEFLKAAFLPVVTAIPFCIGFIMMNALASTNWKTLAGQMASGAPITGGVTTFFDILWMCMALGIIWAGTFKALREHGGMAGMFGEWFNGMGKAIGKIGVLAPLQLPVIPTGVNGKKMGIWGAAQQVNPKRWAQALQYGTGLEDAFKQIRGEGNPGGLDRRKIENKDEITKHINSTNGKEGGTKDALKAAMEPLREELRILGVDTADDKKVAEALRELSKNEDSFGEAQRKQMQRLAEALEKGAAAPPVAP